VENTGFNEEKFYNGVKTKLKMVGNALLREKETCKLSQTILPLCPGL
jgi:hypothetical protein